MVIADKAESGNHSQKNSLIGGGYFFEKTNFIAQNIGICFINGEWFNGKFHLTKIDDLITTINDQINLRFLSLFFAHPGGGCSLYAADPQGLFYLVNMRQANLFKGITAPSPILRAVKTTYPVLFVVRNVFPTRLLPKTATKAEPSFCLRPSSSLSSFCRPMMMLFIISNTNER